MVCVAVTNSNPLNRQDEVEHGVVAVTNSNPLNRQDEVEHGVCGCY